jgi:adenosylmethionine-8-amino-7-oxononanoate aminotransferase
MAGVYFGSSGSGAMEVAIKTVFMYFHFKDELQRKFIISLKPS